MSRCPKHMYMHFEGTECPACVHEERDQCLNLATRYREAMEQAAEQIRHGFPTNAEIILRRAIFDSKM